VARIVLSPGRSAEEVLDAAFASLGIKRWGGMTGNGWSVLSDLLRCPYRYYLKREAHLQSIHLTADSSFAQDIGSYGHAILAAYYAGFLPDSRYPGYRHPCPTPEQMIDALNNAGADPMALAVARECWEGYVDHWGEDGLTPMAVEMLAGDEAIHTCRYDLIANVADGIHDGVWALDYKFLSQSANPDHYELNGEIIGEALAWELGNLTGMFGPLVGVCINVLFKGKTKRPYFRRWFPFKPEIIADFRKSRLHWKCAIEGYRIAGYWPKNHYGCVAHFDDACQFFDHCRTLDNSHLMKKETP
jgi:hypothetical protein